MNNLQKLGLALLIIFTLVFIKNTFFPGANNVQMEETAMEEYAQQQEEIEDTPKVYVSVYFIGQNNNQDEVYKIMKREYQGQENGTKLKYSIENLLVGPTSEEKAKGIYSEIPSGTRLLSLDEKPDKVIINLSRDFEQGGGTDSLYKRLYQLIKTANKNTTLDVFLNIEGKQANIIGGEGIMITQPLNNNSLGG